MNTEEIYHVLRKRLFESEPSKDDIRDVARAYAHAVKDAKQMDITSASPDKFGQLIQESYPFHPSIRDLYARFRENPGFQQTRGLIRLMRILVSRLYDLRGPRLFAGRDFHQFWQLRPQCIETAGFRFCIINRLFGKLRR